MSRFSLIYIGLFSIIISILSFFNIIYSYYFNFYLNLNNYVYSLIISLLFSALFIFKKKDLNKPTIYEKILTVVSGYLIIPIFISIPYYLSIYNISFIDSYFESISGFTSTGFSIFENVKHLDPSIILWRSSSQWVGGLYFLFSIILLIDIFDINLKKSLTNFLSFNTSEISKQYLKILILYTSLTFVIFIILKLINIRTFDSFNLAITLISSGGFLPTNDLNSILNNKIKIITTSFLMLFSFFSIFLSYNLLRIKNKTLNFFQEDFYLSIYLFFLIVFFFLLFNYEYNFSDIFLSLASSVSNIGISTKSFNNNNLFILFILTIIGGSFFSTSSGIRFIKLFTLFKYSINELISHVKPKNVFITKLRFSKLISDTSDINKIFLSLLIFIISLIILSSILTITGINFENSLKISILTLMNTVNSDMHNLSDFSFQNLQYITKYSLILFMIIGRVELLTILIILKKFFLKN